MKKMWLLPLLAILVISFSCQKRQPSFWFKGMQIVDTNQQFVRWVGEPDYDWQINKYTLTAQQQSLLKVSYDINTWYLTNPGTVVVTPGPNPLGYSSDTTDSYYQFSVQVQSNCIFTYALTDQYMNVIEQGNIATDSGQVINPLISIPPSSAHAGQVYRIYYGFSAAGHVLFATGWGDIGICNLTPSGRVGSCF